MSTFWITYTTLEGVAARAQIDAYNRKQAVNTFLARSIEPVEIVTVEQEIERESSCPA